MTRISPFLSESYSEDLYSISEAEFDEVMSTPAVIGDQWQGYGEWSTELESGMKQEASLAPSTLYVDPKDGKVKQIPEPPSRGRIGGIEI